MPDRVASSVFVGRQAELDRILDALDAAARGRGRLLLIAGEAGVGKTRLIEEAAAKTRDAGGLAGVGACVEMGSAPIPFAPFRTVLRGMAVALGEQRFEAAGGTRSELAALVPTLDPVPTHGDRIGVGADSLQERMFESCLDLLRRIGSDRPLLLVVEDIHWADGSTLDLIRYLAQGAAEAPFVLATSFRSDELHRRHPLQPFLGEIQRARTTERIDLRRFSEEEVGQQLSAILGQPAEGDLVERVYARSDGNAFYAEELVAVERSGEPLPPAMRDVLLARMGALSAPTQELLRTVAAGGSHVNTAILARVTRYEPEALEANLREAVDRHLLVAADVDGEERLLFRHALVREAVYGELLPGERARLHSRYGEAVEAVHQPSDELSAELAYHWYAAHDLPRALSASIEAARWADAHYAFADAQRSYERALELWDQVGDAGERTNIDRVGLLERAANAAAQTDAPRAGALMLEAISSAEGSVDRARLGLLKERYGRYAWIAGNGFAAIDACREAVALVPAEPPTRARARVLASLGQILMITLQVDEAKATCAAAVDAARGVGAEDIECHALNSLGATNVYLGEWEVGLGQLRESLEMARRSGSVDDVIRAYGNMIDGLAHSGQFVSAGEEAERAYEFAQLHGMGGTMIIVALAEGALAYYRLGRWDAATDLLRRAWRPGMSGVPRIMVEQRMALLDVNQGRNDIAAQRIHAARPLIERAVEAQLIAPLAEAAAELALWQARPLEARAEISAACQRLEARPSYISRLGPLYALGIRAEADVSLIARARREERTLANSAVIAVGYVTTMRQLHAAAAAGLPNFVSDARAWLAACEAEMTRLAGQSAPAEWSRSADAFGEIPMAYPRAYSLWREAEAELAVTHNRVAATQTLRESHRIAAELGASPLLAEIDSLALRAGIDLAEPVRKGLTADVNDPLGLTPREHEILKLIAAGRSNRQIADELFITVGTAGTHVSNILGKLGVRGRTEAAAVSHRMGLID